MFVNLCRLALLSSTLLITTIAYSLPDDREQPINVSADHAQKNDKTGLIVYKGDVVITQGSVRISGDKVTIHDDNGTIKKIVAKGQPAKFKQKPELNSEDVIAHGNTLEYYLEEESLLLEGDALLKQDGRTTNSNKITYDINTTVVNAGDNDGRVEMVIEPSKK